MHRRGDAPQSHARTPQCFYLMAERRSRRNQARAYMCGPAGLPGELAEPLEHLLLVGGAASLPRRVAFRGGRQPAYAGVGVVRRDANESLAFKRCGELSDVLVRRPECGGGLLDRGLTEGVDDGDQNGLLGRQPVLAELLVHQGAQLLGQEQDQPEGADSGCGVVAERDLMGLHPSAMTVSPRSPVAFGASSRKAGVDQIVSRVEAPMWTNRIPPPAGPPVRSRAGPGPPRMRRRLAAELIHRVWEPHDSRRSRPTEWRCPSKFGRT